MQRGASRISRDTCLLREDSSRGVWHDQSMRENGPCGEVLTLLSTSNMLERI